MSLILSIVIPVYNAAAELRCCLEALRRSQTAPAECIVVDDGSTDQSAAVAREFGAVVIRSERRGPASARNLGAGVAGGDVLFFIDSDVCVHQDTISRILSDLEADPTLDAVIGCYDDSPASGGLIAQYRNLRQCYVHRQACRRASTFWTGCGAIRRLVFLGFGGFDERYLRPSIEDIELGCRLSQANRKIALDNSVLVKHLKQWTLWSLLITDIVDRGIPWTELILKHRWMPNDLNLRVRERAAAVLAWLLCALVILGSIGYGILFAACLMALPAAGMAIYRGPRAGCVRPRLPAYMIYLVSALAVFWPAPPAAALVTWLVLVALVAAERDFYFLVESRIGRAGALALIPLHLLYHLYSAVAFVAGTGRYAWSSAAGVVRDIRSPEEGSRDAL